ncbi:MAG: cell division protein ZapA [Acholeplasmataceae bacterium]|jgi:cell division protein ZapA|nr:cell division protein ZapA [Acholeplasmataceae bacterium]
MEKQKIVLRIFNDEYQIKTEMPEEELLVLANIVNNKMLKIAKNQSALTPSKVAVLAALELASELNDLKNDYNDIIKIVTGKNDNNQKG